MAHHGASTVGAAGKPKQLSMDHRYDVGPQGQVEEIGTVKNRAGRIYLTPPYFLAKTERTTPILNLCLGYNIEGKWRIPNYVPELSSVCTAAQYKAFAQELATTMKANEMNMCWEQFAVYCCLCTLGLSCVPTRCFKERLRSMVQAVCDRHAQQWHRPTGTLIAHQCGSQDMVTVKEAGLWAIPVDETGSLMLDNLARQNKISPEAIKAAIAKEAQERHEAYLRANKIIFETELFPTSNHRPEQIIEIIDKMDQDMVLWPPMGLTIQVRLSDLRVMQMWPTR